MRVNVTLKNGDVYTTTIEESDFRDFFKKFAETNSCYVCFKDLIVIKDEISCITTLS
jgi:hypothetical protein